MTYLMALLILIGAGLVFFAKYLARQRTAPKRAHEDMARSTEKLKRELERSGGEIVKRMGGHVERLEALIAESDRRSDSLDAQLTELHTLSQTIDKEIDELRAAEQDARREQQLASQLLGELRAAAAGAAAMRQAVPMVQTPSTPSPIERVDAQDFTSVLEHSIARDEARQPSSAPAYVPTAASVHTASDVAQTMQGRSQAQGLAERQSKAASPAVDHVAPVAHPTPMAMEEASLATAKTIEAAEEISEPTQERVEEETPKAPLEDGGARSAARVRALLLSGWSVEDIAKETGMGKGAIELMQEMIRRQLADDGQGA